MDTNEFLTAAEAAQMFSMSVNAFRIFVHRYGKSVKRVRLGKRRTFFRRADLIALLETINN